MLDYSWVIGLSHWASCGQTKAHLTAFLREIAQLEDSFVDCVT